MIASLVLLTTGCFSGSTGIGIAISGGSSGGGTTLPSETTAVIEEREFALSKISRDGIPVPFIVSDSEGDTLDVIFQWTFEGEDFPDLGLNSTELRSFLGNRAERKKRRIFTEASVSFTGAVRPSLDKPNSPLEIRLQEVAQEGASILAAGGPRRGIEGRTLEILRPPRFETFTPVGLSQLGRIEDLVVDPDTGDLLVLSAIAENWVLSRIEPGEQDPPEMLIDGQGSPFAMTLSASGKFLVVATGVDSEWILVRIALEGPPAVERLASSMNDDDIEGGEVHSLTSIGDDALLLSTASSLIRVDTGSSMNERVTTLLSSLNGARSLVMLNLRTVLIAQEFNHQILALNLETLEQYTLLDGEASGTFSRPTLLDLDRFRGLVLFVCSPPDSGLLATGGTSEKMLCGFRPGRSSGIFIESHLGDVNTLDLESGPDGLRFAVIEGLDSLLVAGGVEQSRIIESFEPQTQTATVTSPFLPSLERTRSWRIQDRASRVGTDGRQGETKDIFVWNTADVPQGGLVLIRVVAIDNDPLVEPSRAVSRFLTSSFDVEPCFLDGVTKPISVTALDLDQDLDIDLVVSNDSQASAPVSILRQTEPGQFRRESIGPSGTSSIDHALGDLDGDDDVDLVVASFQRQKLILFLQIDGSFVEQDQRLSLPLARRVRIGDVDCDGQPDIVGAGDESILIFRQMDGIFVAEPPPFPVENPRALDLSDIDGDGQLDFIWAYLSESGPRLVLALQEQTFEFGVTQINIEKVGNPTSLSIGDLSGDGRADVVVGGDGGFLVTVGQTEEADFVVQSEFLLAEVDRVRRVVLEDVNQDGLLDALISAEDRGLGRLLIGFGEPGFSFAPRLLKLQRPNLLGPLGVAVADLDGDGNPDLISTNNTGSDVALHFQAAPGRFSPAGRGSLEPKGEPLSEDDLIGDERITRSPESVIAFDLDGDGDQDIASANSSSDNITIFFQDGPGLLKTNTLILSLRDILELEENDRANPVGIDAGDLDGNGLLDLVVVMDQKSLILTFLQLSPGRFETGLPPIVLSEDNVATSLTVNDLDADGRLDLVARVRGSGDPRVLVFFGKGDGEFESSVELPTDHAPSAFALLDLDGNGHLDVATVSDVDFNVNLIQQTASRSFEFMTSLLGNRDLEQPEAILSADLNSDLRPDLVITDTTNGLILLLSQEDSFMKKTLDHSGFRGPIQSVATDVDNDGLLDLVVADERASALFLFRQSGNGSFLPAPLSLRDDRATGPRSLVAQDVDGDGTIDLISSNGGSNNLAVFYGNP